MIQITINGEQHNIAVDTPDIITYEEICELGGYNSKLSPSMMCQSPMRMKHIILPGEICPVEVGAKYSIEYTGNA